MKRPEFANTMKDKWGLLMVSLWIEMILLFFSNEILLGKFMIALDFLLYFCGPLLIRNTTKANSKHNLNIYDGFAEVNHLNFQFASFTPGDLHKLLKHFSVILKTMVWKKVNSVTSGPLKPIWEISDGHKMARIHRLFNRVINFSPFKKC